MNSNEFGDALRLKRLAHKISVTDAANLLGVSHSTWVRWEAGTSVPLTIVQTSAMTALDIEGGRRSREGFSRLGRPPGANPPKS